MNDCVYGAWHQFINLLVFDIKYIIISNTTIEVNVLRIKWAYTIIKPTKPESSFLINFTNKLYL